MLRRRFLPKRDWWVWPSAIFVAVVAVVVLVVAQNKAVAIVVAAFAAWHVLRLVTTWYELGASELVVVRWPLRRHYPLENIVRVRSLNRLNIPPSSIGMTLRRRNESFSYDVLVVELERGPVREVYISPREREEFLQQLRFRAPHVTVDG